MTKYSSPEIAFENIDIDFDFEAGDDGIGAYEYWGAYGYDSRPYAMATCSGTVELFWTSTEAPEAEVQFTVLRVGPYDIEVDIVVKSNGPFTAVEEGGVWHVTQTFEYEGQGSGDPVANDDGPDDDGPGDHWDSSWEP